MRAASFGTRKGLPLDKDPTGFPVRRVYQFHHARDHKEKVGALGDRTPRTRTAKAPPVTKTRPQPAQQNSEAVRVDVRLKHLPWPLLCLRWGCKSKRGSQMPDREAPRPGPEPERLKIDGNWKDAIGRALKKERPEGGWPKSPTKKRAKKKSARGE